MSTKSCFDGTDAKIEILNIFAEIYSFEILDIFLIQHRLTRLNLTDSPGNTSTDGSLVRLVGFVGVFFQLSGLRFRFLVLLFSTTGEW